MLSRQSKTIPITARQQFILAVLAIAPNRANSVNDPARGKIVAFGDLRLARRAAIQSTALFQELRACRTVNRAIDSAAAQQRRVGGIHDGIHFLIRDVAIHNFDSVL